MGKFLAYLRAYLRHPAGSWTLFQVGLSLLVCDWLVLRILPFPLLLLWHGLGMLGTCLLVSMLAGTHEKVHKWLLTLLGIGSCLLYVVSLSSWQAWGRPMSLSLLWHSLATPVAWGSLWAHFPPELQGVLAGLLVLTCAGIGWLWRQVFPLKPILNFRSPWQVLAVSSLLLLSVNAYRVGGPLLNVLRPRIHPPVSVEEDTFVEAVARSQALQQLEQPHLSQPPHLILILVDALRADHLPQYSYERNTFPHLQNWTERLPFQQVEWAFSSCSHSVCGIHSTLEGLFRQEMGQMVHPFFAPLQQVGYETHLYLSGVQHPLFYLDQTMAPYVDHFGDGSGQTQLAPYDDQLVLDAVEALPKAGTQPQFFYLHLMSAHTNRSFDSSFQQYEPVQDMRNWGRADPASYDQAATVNTYDNGLLQTDDFLEKILTQFEEKGYLKNTLLVLSGDHGEGLGEHGQWGHRYDLYPEMSRIPLLLLDTDSNRHYENWFAGQVDIAPTMLDRVGLPLPDFWSGQSLLSRAGEERWLLQQTEDEPQKRGILLPAFPHLYQYRWDTADDSESIFDLTADPLAQHPLAQPDSTLWHRFRAIRAAAWP